MLNYSVETQLPKCENVYQTYPHNCHILSTQILSSSNVIEKMVTNQQQPPKMASNQPPKMVTNQNQPPKMASNQQQLPKLAVTPVSPTVTAKSNKTLSAILLLHLDTAIELISALLYGGWAILLAVVITFIPRRFRYKDVTGQVILITGAGSGIGRLMAKKFAIKHGAIVVAWDINHEGNEETKRSILAAGGECHAYTVDVSSREGIYKGAELVKKEIGKVDILINNAGIVFGKRLLETPDEHIVKTFQVNALSNFWTAKAFLPAMLESGRGHIVTVASLAGLCGTNRLIDYCASKFAAVGFDEALKNEIKGELGQKDIHATLVCPYYINTGMFDGVRSKIIPLLSPEPVVNDIVAGILTNQEQIVIPRYVYILVVLRLLVPGEVGRRVANAVGISGAMLSFRGSATKKSAVPAALTAKTVPVSTVPVSTVPVSTVPVSTVPVSTVPVSTVPVSTVPVSTVPASTVPVSTVPASTVPAATVPASTVPVSTVPAATVPASTVPGSVMESF